MKFSILIANYNNGKYFKDCYDSIINQTYKNWEVIIVDDKSTDDSLQIIRGLIKNDDRFKLYENEKNEGCGFTKRKCMELVKGDLCAFVDPDDAITEDALACMVQEHEAHPETALVHSKLYYCDESLQTGPIYEFAKPVDNNNQFTNLDYAVTAFASFKTNYYNKTVGIDSSLLRAVDQDLYLKLSETGKFIYIDKALYKYRIHQMGLASTSGGKAKFQHLKVIAMAEKRRNVNLEDEVAPYLNNPTVAVNNDYLNNYRFLVARIFYLIKSDLKKTFGVKRAN